MQGQEAGSQDNRSNKDIKNQKQLAKRDIGGMKYMSKEQIDRLKRFQRRYKKAETMRRPTSSPHKIQTAKQNNFMEETKDQPGSNRDIDNTEMVFDDNHAQLVSRSKFGYDLGD